jgi:hypothetical protein
MRAVNEGISELVDIQTCRDLVGKKPVVAMGKGMQKMLEDSGLQGEDIPKAILIHEVLGLGVGLATWGVCPLPPFCTNYFVACAGRSVVV